MKMGLSPWSEQTTESLHHDFAKTWNNFKVRDMDHPQYGEHLLQALDNDTTPKDLWVNIYALMMVAVTKNRDCSCEGTKIRSYTITYSLQVTYMEKLDEACINALVERER